VFILSVEKLIKAKQLDNYGEFIEGTSVNNLEDEKNNINKNKFMLLKKIREKLVENYSMDNKNKIEKYNTIRTIAISMIEDEASKKDFNVYLDSYDKAEILENIMQNIFGYGILDPLISNENITEIMVNGTDKIFIEKSGTIERAKNNRGEYLKFNNRDELLHIIEKIVAPINRKVDESNPIVDARLPNGFRVNIVLNPISLEGHLITIRKFPENPYTMDELVKFGMLPSYVADFIKTLVKARYNIIVSGGTGTGKTTFLNALSNYIGGNERIITIEDSAELKIANVNNLIRMETRQANIEGKGEITVRDLVRTALRMRPDRIVVGEVRGGEALDMLQAMNTGHDGSLSTGHANSSFDMLSRLETMVLMSGIELPLNSIRKQIASAVEIIIHLGRIQDGKRKVIQITEVSGVNNGGYVTQDLFTFRKNTNVNNGRGFLHYTGEQMKRVNKFTFSGVEAVDFNKLLKIDNSEKVHTLSGTELSK
jgi:pilus assembly protein CpaF